MAEDSQAQPEEVEVLPEDKPLGFWHKVWLWLKQEERFELEIWFHSETMVTETMKTVKRSQMKTYNLKKIIKLNQKVVEAIDEDGNRVSIKTVEPFDYNLRKIKLF